MLDSHLAERMSALVDGELTRDEARRADAHLAECAQCRDARAAYDFAARALQRMPMVSAPDAIWDAIERDLEQTGGAGAASVVTPIVARLKPRPSTWIPAMGLAAGLLLAVASVTWWQARGPKAWDVRHADGGRMSIGEWIETSAGGRARINIGQIGTVDIEPNSRVQLLAAKSDEHRLNLARGTVSAQILAPPRLFFVETPASTVVDLGCAYTMTVDEAGTGILRVTSGWASLEWSGRESIVPAGASCPTRPAVGPGTPAFDDASTRLKEALVAFDFGKHDTETITTILDEARPRDTLTLWHLLSRVEASERGRVFDRIAALIPVPRGVTRERVLALDANTLRAWREELAWSW